ncbi:unnamed protein product, partial [Discosporangium mesarthrocarpum]
MMENESTVAKYIRRFREAKPLPPQDRRRHRAGMAGEFWWLNQGQEHAPVNGTTVDHYEASPLRRQTEEKGAQEEPVEEMKGNPTSPGGGSATAATTSLATLMGTTPKSDDKAQSLSPSTRSLLNGENNDPGGRHGNTRLREEDGDNIVNHASAWRTPGRQRRPKAVQPDCAGSCAKDDDGVIQAQALLEKGLATLCLPSTMPSSPTSGPSCSSPTGQHCNPNPALCSDFGRGPSRPINHINDESTRGRNSDMWEESDIKNKKRDPGHYRCHYKEGHRRSTEAAFPSSSMPPSIPPSIPPSMPSHSLAMDLIPVGSCQDASPQPGLPSWRSDATPAGAWSGGIGGGKPEPRDLTGYG